MRNQHPDEETHQPAGPSCSPAELSALPAVSVAFVDFKVQFPPLPGVSCLQIQTALCPELKVHRPFPLVLFPKQYDNQLQSTYTDEVLSVIRDGSGAHGRVCAGSVYTSHSFLRRAGAPRMWVSPAGPSTGPLRCQRTAVRVAC